MAHQDLAKSLKETVLKCLEETFVNVQGIYLDKNTSLLETLETISAEEASRTISAKVTTIAAHTEHARFYLQVLEDYMLEKTIGKIDWEETWRKTEVTLKEWTALKTELKERYQQMLSLVKSFDSWEGEHQIGGAIAVLMHTAYHIGAIRQIMAVVKSSSI